MRALPDEIVYKDFLLNIGNGTLPTFDRYKETIKLPDECIIDQHHSIIDAIFGRFIDPNDTSVYGKAILCPKNNARSLNLLS